MLRLEEVIICVFENWTFNQFRCFYYRRRHMMENPTVFLLYAKDGIKIADTVKERLEQNETTVHVADVLKIHDEFPSSLLVLFLTPEMLSLLKSPNAPDLKSVHHKSNKCALFFHDTINFAGDPVQQILNQKVPSYEKWHRFGIEKKVRATVLQILNLIETVDVAIPDLVSDCKLYPDDVWEVCLIKYMKLSFLFCKLVKY